MAPHTRTKILLLITKANFGGAQRYVYDIATHLDTREFEPVVLLGGAGPLKEMLEHAHVRVISIPTLAREVSLTKEWRAFWQIFRTLRQERPDVLHVNSSKAGGIGALAGRLTRVRHILFTAHGWAFNEDRPWWQRIIIKFLHWLTILLSHTTVVVARGTRLQMNWPLVQEKMVVIYPGRTIGVTYGKSAARSELAKRTRDPQARTTGLWLGTVAELSPIKQIDVAIRAVAALPPAAPPLNYLIVGDGPEREHLSTLIHELGVSDHVHLLGNVPDAARFLKAFDMFLLPSRSEAFPYAVTEAGQAGLPVIASRVGGVPDTIQNGENGLLITPGSVPECTNAIIKLAKHKALREQLGSTLQERTQKLTAEKMVSELTVLYRKRG